VVDDRKFLKPLFVSLTRGVGGILDIKIAFHGRCIPFDHASGRRISACFFMFLQLLEPSSDLLGKNINEVKTFMEKTKKHERYCH